MSAGLPRGKAAMTVSVGGRKFTYYEKNGQVFESLSVGSTASGTPISTGKTLGDMYRNALASGANVSLHSKSEVAKANLEYSRRREENRKDVGYAEMHPNAGSAGIAARNLVYRPRRR